MDSLGSVVMSKPIPANFPPCLSATIRKHAFIAEHNSSVPKKLPLIAPMDRGEGHDQDPPSSPTRPLCIRKQPSPVRLSRPQHRIEGDSVKPPKNSSRQRYPPRTSSLLRDNDSGVSRKCKRGESIHGRQKSDNSPTSKSLPSNPVHNSISDPSFGDSTAHSTVSSLKERYLSGSTDIIGDFIPVNADMAFLSRKAEHRTVSPNA